MYQVYPTGSHQNLVCSHLLGVVLAIVVGRLGYVHRRAYGLPPPKGVPQSGDARLIVAQKQSMDALGWTVACLEGICSAAESVTGDGL